MMSSLPIDGHQRPFENPATLPWIVVGVDGTPSSLHALDWAAALASVRDVGLDVIAAYHGPWLSDPTALVGYPFYLESAAAKEVIQDAVEQVGSEFPAVSATATVRSGGAASALLQEARGAALVVIGRSHVGSNRATTLKVIRRAKVPVAVVGLADDESSRPATGQVVLVTGEGRTSAAMFETAFISARTRGAALHILLIRATHTDQAMLQRWRDRFPDVRVGVKTMSERTIDYVEAVSSGAALIVLPGAAKRKRWSRRALSPWVGALLAEASSPVLLIPPEWRPRGEALSPGSAAGARAVAEPNQGDQHHEQF